MNIYDIAKEAGVSISTVSRVLNNKSNVRTETRKRVEAVLEKHDYAPSSIARGLVYKSLDTVGILTIDIRVPHYAETAYILERELYKLGYNAILCNTGGKAENGIDYITTLMQTGVRGIILIGSVFQNKYIETSLINSFSHIPFIVMNSRLSADNIYSVLLNQKHGMALCLDHLAEKGHTDILYVQDAETFSGENKAAAFIELSGERGVSDASERLFKTSRGVVGGREVIDRIIESKRKFSAIVFGDDNSAIGGMQRLHELNRRIPDDVAIIGWNNTKSSTLCVPYLTTVDNQNEMIGVISVKLLENILAGSKVSRNISIDSGLIVRDST
ncbi:MAG: LacI family transcriptional regulator [Clostridiales Family XIII bacterium]|jgi:LacI family transcriptional regulator|nr:LacI family transcriptional regulator [Clostridiales Family XIII bacterium]